jgi:hypothetical protein
VATSTLRAVILVAVVVLGVLGLTKLFPTNASIGVTPSATGVTNPSTTLSPSASASNSPSPTRKPKKNNRVTVLVLNATTQTGLAADTTTTLQNDNYKTKTPSDFLGPDQDVTIVYYQPDFLPEAQKLKDKFFPTARLEVAPASVPADVDIEVVLGADVAEA